MERFRVKQSDILIQFEIQKVRVNNQSTRDFRETLPIITRQIYRSFLLSSYIKKKPMNKHIQNLQFPLERAVFRFQKIQSESMALPSPCVRLATRHDGPRPIEICE